MYYPTSMPSLMTKWKKGRPYLYWVRSTRVKGQSRMVEPISLGPQERVLEHLRVQRTASAPPRGHAPAPHRADPGVWSLGAGLCRGPELGLVALSNTSVPPAPPGR